MAFTLEKLKSLSVAERHQLYKNARSNPSPEAKALVRMIEDAGLPYSESGGIRNDDPLSLKIHEIVNSSEGVEAAMEAQREGFPPMARIDIILVRELGVDYGPHNMSTNQAGSFVAELMRAKGFRKIGEASLPPGCVAKSGATFESI